MAFFKSEEQKEKERMEKERKVLEKYGVGNLTDQADLESVKKIAAELVGTGAMEAGIKIAMTDPKIQLPIAYQHAIMEQNFIIIRQLDKIAKLLSEK